MEIEGPFLKRFQICALGLDNECLKTLEEADTLDEARAMQKAQMRRGGKVGIFADRKSLDE
jgi:hypothetical protein